MALVEYGSDSDDELSTPPPPPSTTAAGLQFSPIASVKASQSSTLSTEPIGVVTNEPAQSLDDPIVGPSRPPPTLPSPEPNDEDDQDQGPPQSPYSVSRSLIHTLTLPPSIPSIPPSPPGSPPPSLSSKLAHFRDLKTQGVHFNEKLPRSSSLRNPNLLQKLMAFVGFNGTDQYATNLPAELWDPSAFKKEAFVKELAASQAKIADARERAKLEHGREGVEFVSSVQIPAAQVQLQEPPRERTVESATDRVTRVLDRERKSVGPPARDSRRDRDGGRGGRRDERGERRRDEDYRDRRRDDDRDRRRRRSRSRSRDRERGDRRYKDVEYRDRR